MFRLRERGGEGRSAAQADVDGAGRAHFRTVAGGVPELLHEVLGDERQPRVLCIHDNVAGVQGVSLRAVGADHPYGVSVPAPPATSHGGVVVAALVHNNRALYARAAAVNGGENIAQRPRQDGGMW